MSDVKVAVTFRHTQPTNALRHYAGGKIHRSGKYFSRRLEAYVVLSVDSKERSTTAIELHAQGNMIHGNGGKR